MVDTGSIPYEVEEKIRQRRKEASMFNPNPSNNEVDAPIGPDTTLADLAARYPNDTLTQLAERVARQGTNPETAVAAQEVVKEAAPVPSNPGGAPVEGVVRMPINYAAGATTDVPDVHTVQPGDTLQSIAGLYYGHPGAWQQVYTDNAETIGANPGATLEPGTEIKLQGTTKD